MVFYADSPRIDFETKLDWADRHRFLKAAFDTDIQTDFARQEIQFGHVLRPTTANTTFEQAKFETLNHKFTDVSEHRYGVALLNDCKYGIAVRGGSMRLSLMKSGTHPDERGDKGVHLFTYSLLPHDGAFGSESVVRPAYELNSPVLTTGGKLQLKPLVVSSADNVIVETVKPCEDAQKAYILRLYECEKNRTHTELRFSHPVKKVYLADMLENRISELPLSGNAVSLTLRPFAIQTLLVEY